MTSIYNTTPSTIALGTTTFDNSTDVSDEDPTYFQIPLHRIIRLILVYICGLLSIVLNAMNLAVLKNIHTACLGEATMKVIKVLAVVDLCTGIVVIAMENAYLLTSIPDHWDGFCKTLFPMVIFLGLFSCFLLGLLSFDRYMAIRKPLRHPMLFTNKSLNGMILFCGFVAMCDAVLASWRNFPLEGYIFNEDTRFCRTKMPDDISSSLYLMIANSTVILAVIAISCINIHLVIIAWHHVRKIRNLTEISSQATESTTFTGTTNRCPEPMTPPPTRRPRIKRRDEFRVLRTVLVMTLSFYLAWLPMVVDIAMYVISGYDTPAPYEFFTYYMLYCSSCWNPVIYLLMNRAYRKAMERHVVCRCVAREGYVGANAPPQTKSTSTL